MSSHIYLVSNTVKARLSFCLVWDILIRHYDPRIYHRNIMQISRFARSIWNFMLEFIFLQGPQIRLEFHINIAQRNASLVFTMSLLIQDDQTKSTLRTLSSWAYIYILLAAYKIRNPIYKSKSKTSLTVNLLIMKLVF